MSAFCLRCAEALVNPEEPCAFCVGEKRESAVKALLAAAKSGGNAALVTRVDAMDALRNLGHSSEQVLLARAQALDGLSVEEIVRGLVDGDRELETVA